MNGDGPSESAGTSAAVPQALLTLQTYFAQFEKEKLAWSRERHQLKSRVRELESQLARLSGASGAGAAAAAAATATLRAARTGGGGGGGSGGAGGAGFGSPSSGLSGLDLAQHGGEAKPGGSGGLFPGVSPDKKYNTFGGRLKSSLFKGSLRRNSILKQFLVTFGLNEADSGAAAAAGPGTPSGDGGSRGGKDRKGSPSPPAGAGAGAGGGGGGGGTLQQQTARKRSLSSGSGNKNTDLSHIDKLSDKALDDMQRLMIQNTTKGASAQAKLSAYQRGLAEMREMRRSLSNSGSDTSPSGGGGRSGKHGSMSVRKSSLFAAQTVFQAHVGAIRTLHACADDRRFLTGGDDGLVKLWSGPTTNGGGGGGAAGGRKCVRVFRGAGTGPVFAAAYVPSEGGGGVVLSAGRDPAVNVWRVPAAGAELGGGDGGGGGGGASPFTRTQIRAHSDAVWGIVPRGGGSGEVLCVGADGFVSFVDVHAFLRNEPPTAGGEADPATAGIIHRFAFESQVSAATPNPTAAAFLHGSAGGRGGGCVVAFDVSTLIHFDLETGRRVATLNPDAARPVDLHPYSLVCDPASGLVFSGHESGDILCWDVRANGASVVLSGGSGGGGSNGGGKNKKGGNNAAGCDFRFPKAHDGAVTTLCLDQYAGRNSGGGHPLLLSGSVDGGVKVWDLRSTAGALSSPVSPDSPSSKAAPVQKIAQTHLGGVFGLQQQQGGRQLLSCGADGFVRCYERKE